MYIIKPGKFFDFMSARKYFLVFSLVLIVGSIVSMFLPGPNWGTDFKGGTEVEVLFKKPVDASEVRDAMAKAGFHSPDVVSTENNGFLIRVQEVSELLEGTKQALRDKMCFADGPPPAGCTPEITPNELKFSPGGDKITARYEVKPDVPEITKRVQGIPGIKLRGGEDNVSYRERDHRVEILLASRGEQIMEGLLAHFGPEVVNDRAERMEWIGAKAGADLRTAALTSIGITLFFVMLYIALRFDVRFAPGAIVALAHDVIVVVGAMCITQREITLSTVAAILTIIGYSLSDTVVVFDRIRENLGKFRNKSFPDLVNLSVSEMLGRTIVSNGTSMLALICFLWFGTQVIKDFAFAMLVGAIVGTYSSIYVAAPFTEWVDRRFFANKVVKARPKPPRQRAQKQADAVV